MKYFQYLLLHILCCCAIATFAQNDNPVALGDLVKVTFENKIIEAKLVGIATTSDSEYPYTAMSIAERYLGNKRITQGELDINVNKLKTSASPSISIFEIEANYPEALTFEIFDAEGYNRLLNCTFDVQVGWNYIAVDIQALESGTYTIRLTNKVEDEFTRVLLLTKS